MTDLAFGRDALGDPARAGRLEWFVANGIGGYSAGAVTGAISRRYHGLLVAALHPPLGRTLMLAKLGERIDWQDRSVALDTNVWASGAVTPAGYLNLEAFRLEDTVPVWTWAIGDVRLEKRIWMEQGENTTCIQYRLVTAPEPVRLTLEPIVDHRDVHGATRRGVGVPRVEPAAGGIRVEVTDGATPLWLLGVNAEFRPAAEWYRGYALPLEAERGFDASEDHVYVGQVVTRLKPGETFTLVASTRRDAGAAETAPLARIAALTRRRAHEKSVLDAWKRAQPTASRLAPPWVRRLVLAADAFVVERSSVFDPGGHSVIAGYPWFADWGRDTMIALPGLTLATGRPEVGRAILATWLRLVSDGMLPNTFPERGDAPEFNTVDAALWLIHAVRAHFDATGDAAFLAEAFPVLEGIIAACERGTRWNIGVDAHDGLLKNGGGGVALTWMDARVDGVPVTPREGKCVEVNALWYGAAIAMAAFARRLGHDGARHVARARRVEGSFARFWNAGSGCLYDVLDGPGGDDARIRPNQIFAVSLPDSPLNAAQRRAVVDVCGRHLLTSHGLRSLSPADPGYVGTYAGDPRQRDAAYHQGTVWTWLLPSFAIAHERVHGDRDRALAFLEPMAQLIAQSGVGSLPEIADGDPPHTPRGCFAQAWSVAEVLRVWHLLSAERRRPRRRNVPRTAMAMGR